MVCSSVCPALSLTVLKFSFCRQESEAPAPGKGSSSLRQALSALLQFGNWVRFSPKTLQPSLPPHEACIFGSGITS